MKDRTLDAPEVRIRELREIAAQAPVALVQKETLEKVFVSHDDFTMELLKRFWVLILGLGSVTGAVLGILKLVGVI